MCSNCNGGNYDLDGPRSLAVAPERDSDNFEQAVRSATASYYHTNLVALIHERVGEGEPLDILLHDSHYREKFGLKARQL